MDIEVDLVVQPFWLYFTKDLSLINFDRECVVAHFVESTDASRKPCPAFWEAHPLKGL
jgi:hypothetical protein